MDRARLLSHFDTLADTPDAVAKLRSLVLQLAVAGRLLPREPDADAASRLSAELEKARAKAAAEGVAPKAKPLPISDTEKFISDVPAHWIWLRLSQLGWIAGGSTPSMNNPRFWDGGVPWVSPKDMKSAEITSSEMSVSKLALESTSLRLYPKGSILIVGRSGILKRTLPVSVAAIECTVNQDLKVIVPFLEKLSPFIRLLLRGHETYILEHLVKGGMTVQSLKYEEFAQQAFPIPPLAEQKRIVARVEELLALCDELEARQTAAREQRTRLVQSAFDHLTAAATPADFRRHAAFALQEFPHLTATPDSIPALRQAILSLAVQGHLVERNIRDGDATALLQKIGASSIEPDNAPLIAAHWKWANLGSLVTQMNSGWSPDCPSTPAGKGEWGVLRTTAVQTLRYLEEENKVLPRNLEPRPEHEVKAGDILLTRAGPKNRVGISCVVQATRPRLMISDKIVRFHLHESLDPSFVALCLNAGYSKIVLERLKSGMAESQMNISQPKLKTTPIPIAPLAEQQRIVAKVAALMSWCDELEARLAAAQSAAAALLDSSLHALLAPAD